MCAHYASAKIFIAPLWSLNRAKRNLDEADFSHGSRIFCKNCCTLHNRVEGAFAIIAVTTRKLFPLLGLC